MFSFISMLAVFPPPRAENDIVQDLSPDLKLHVYLIADNKITEGEIWAIMSLKSIDFLGIEWI